MLSEPRDRVLAVVASADYNGIDFVEIAGPRALVVHFLNQVTVVDPALTASITGGASVPTVALQPITAADWTTDAEGRPLLTLTALAAATEPAAQRLADSGLRVVLCGRREHLLREAARDIADVSGSEVRCVVGDLAGFCFASADY